MRLFFILAFALFSSTTTFACGHISVCGLADDRHYHIKLPDGMTKGKRIGAIFFAHGLGGSSQGVVDNPRLIAVADRLGLALVGLKAKRKTGM